MLTFAKFATLYRLSVALVDRVIGVFLVGAGIREHAIAAVIVRWKAFRVTKTSLLSIVETLHTFAALEITGLCGIFLTCTHALNKIVELSIVAAEYECGKILSRRVHFVIAWSLTAGSGSKLTVKFHYIPSDVPLLVGGLCRNGTRARCCR